MASSFGRETPTSGSGLPIRQRGEQPQRESDSDPTSKHLAGTANQPAVVRFSSVTQEISPLNLAPFSSSTVTTDAARPATQNLSPTAEEELRALSTSLYSSRLQQRRLSNFAFEPVSLPVSRVPSNDTGSQPSREVSHQTSRPSPPTSTMHSPPLTPAATLSREAATDNRADSGTALPTLGKVHPDPAIMTPQISPPRNVLPPTSVAKPFTNENDPSSSNLSSRPSSASGQISTRPTTISTGSSVVSPHPKHPPRFNIGPTGDSMPPSRDTTPPETPGSGSGRETPVLQPPSRPFTPTGDKDDPYARSRRPPQPKSLEGIESRFIFGGSKDSRRGHGHTSSSSSSLQPKHLGTGENRAHDPKSSQSFLQTLAKKDHTGFLQDGGSSKHSSMMELKRFFRGGLKKRAGSPSGSIKSSKSGTRTPPHQVPVKHVPFADDHGLQSRYGKFGKVLGSGAGGSVRLMKRSSDGVTFAVKEFRGRHSYESEREYAKKVTAEFCIGSTLHHGNIIETLDIVQEKGRWYEVMEYAPYDLFAIVMTAKMSREEVACCSLQILNGVIYLHSMGLAHRDLKLDNVVVSDQGIMKIIDFGSATVFRYPFENDIVLAHGVVGSDPYLAPEVYDNAKYDPQPVDIWSLAIIFCCMSLRRFPWKAPRMTDNSYKLFASAPTPDQPTADNPAPRTSVPRPHSTADLPEPPREPEHATAYSQPGSRVPSSTDADGASTSTHHHHHHHHHHHNRQSAVPEAAVENGESTTQRSKSTSEAASQPQQVIKGPWRLLRLLPRESRNIIGRMLEIDPRGRATLEEIVADPWISTTPVCRQEEGGLVIHAEGHNHTLEPSGGSASDPSRGSSKK